MQATEWYHSRGACVALIVMWMMRSREFVRVSGMPPSQVAVYLTKISASTYSELVHQLLKLNYNLHQSGEDLISSGLCCSIRTWNFCGHGCFQELYRTNWRMPAFTCRTTTVCLEMETAKQLAWCRRLWLLGGQSQFDLRCLGAVQLNVLPLLWGGFLVRDYFEMAVKISGVLRIRSEGETHV